MSGYPTIDKYKVHLSISVLATILISIIIFVYQVTAEIEKTKNQNDLNTKEINDLKTDLKTVPQDIAVIKTDIKYIKESINDLKEKK